MKISKIIATTALAVVLGAGAASAATYGNIPGGTATNEGLAPLGFANPADGWYGDGIAATAGTVTATMMGYEAGYTNKFKFGNGVESATNTLTGGGGNTWALAGLGSITANHLGGLLDFSFLTSGGGGTSVANGANPDNTIPAPNPGINFFVHYGNQGFDNSGVSAGDRFSELWLFFDDDGANNDDNHDDLVIKLTFESSGGDDGFTPVPVPAAGFLLLGGLGGLAALRRRKKKAA